MGVNRDSEVKRLEALVEELQARLRCSSCRRCGSDPEKERRGVLIYLPSEAEADGTGPDRCPVCDRVPVLALPHNGRDSLPGVDD